MQFFSFFMQQTQARAITYFGCAEILAPTAVFVLVLGINTIAQTLVGAISDRPHRLIIPTDDSFNRP